MSFWSHKDISEYAPQPGKPGNPLWQLGKQAKNAACQLWHNYPKEFVGDNPVSAPIRYAWNALCQEPPTDQNPTLPPPPPFTGGQCCDKSYVVSYEFVVKRCYQNATIDSGTGTKSVTGKINRLVFRNAPPGFSANGLFLEYEDCAGNKFYSPIWTTNQGVADGACYTGSPFDPNANGIDPVASSANILSVVTGDGSPDSCGDIPTNYPDNPPPPVTNYNFNIDEGDNNISIPFSFNGDFTLPLVFVNADVNITVDLGGINFEWSGDLNIGGGGKNPFPTRPPTTKPPGGKPPGGGGDSPKPGNPKVTEKPPETVTENDPLDMMEEEDEEIIWLLITVTKIIENTKYHIEFLNPDDDIYFAGYVAWKNPSIGGYNSAPEIPIRRKQTMIRKPDDFTGFKVRAINGAELTVTVYTQKIQRTVK